MTDQSTTIRAEDALKEAVSEHRSLTRDVWNQFKTHKGALIGSFIFFGILIAVMFGPLIWTIDPTFVDIRSRNQSFSWAHPFGTDQLGRDLLARVLQGGRISMAVGLVAMFIAVLLGTAIGVLAGFFSKLDGPLMRFTDLFLSLPLLPLLLVIVT